MATALEKLELKKAKLLQQYEALQQEKNKINKEKIKLARKTRSGELVALGILLETFLLSYDKEEKSFKFIKKLAHEKLTRTVDKERALTALQKINDKKNHSKGL